MARIIGPDPVSRVAQRFTSARLWEGLPGKTVTVYLDEAGTELASLAAFNPVSPGTPGAAVDGSKVVIGQDSMVPLFWFPDGVDTVYGRTRDGYVLKLVADQDARLDVAGANTARDQRWWPTGAVSCNVDRAQSNMGNNTGLLVSGRLQLAGGLLIPAGKTVTNITFVSGTQAAASVTNTWFCLVDQALNVLAKTEDAGAAAWAANTAKTLALAEAYTAAVDIPVYAGVVVVATTVPDLRGPNSNGGTNGIAPPIAGASTTGLTDPDSLGATAAAITANAAVPFVYLT